MLIVTSRETRRWVIPNTAAAGRSATGVHRIDAWAIVCRRAQPPAFHRSLHHTFRSINITAYLENGATLEKARQMATHASTRTTQLYDRATLDEVVKTNIRG